MIEESRYLKKGGLEITISYLSCPTFLYIPLKSSLITSIWLVKPFTSTLLLQRLYISSCISIPVSLALVFKVKYKRIGPLPHPNSIIFLVF